MLEFCSFRRENSWVYFVAFLSDSFFLWRGKPESWPQTHRISDTVLGLFDWPRRRWGRLETISTRGVSITDSEPLFVRTCVPQILFTRWVEGIDFCHRSTWSFLILKLRVVKLLEFGSVESTRYSLSHYLHDRHNGFTGFSPRIKATVINKSSVILFCCDNAGDRVCVLPLEFILLCVAFLIAKTSSSVWNTLRLTSQPFLCAVFLNFWKYLTEMAVAEKTGNGCNVAYPFPLNGRLAERACTGAPTRSFWGKVGPATLRSFSFFSHNHYSERFSKIQEYRTQK